jgi:hypothetical protein
VQAVHRYFVSTVQVATERGLRVICDEQEIEVRCALREQAQRIVERLAGKISESDARRIMGLVGKHPHFDDYLNAVMGKAGLTRAEAIPWREFFRALSIIRNKVSHSDTTLTAQDVSRINAGGLSAAIKADGTLGWGPPMYAPVLNRIAQFFRLVLSRLNTA